MAQPESEEHRQNLESYLRTHLKKDERELPAEDQIELLSKQDRKKWYHLLINIAALLLFGYSFYFGLTQLSLTFFFIIAGVFSVNVILIFYQKRQINQLIDFLKQRNNE